MDRAFVMLLLILVIVVGVIAVTGCDRSVINSNKQVVTYDSCIEDNIKHVFTDMDIVHLEELCKNSDM